jgi:hypothetical protein
VSRGEFPFAKPAQKTPNKKESRQLWESVHGRSRARNPSASCCAVSLSEAGAGASGSVERKSPGHRRVTLLSASLDSKEKFTRGRRISWMRGVAAPRNHELRD